jgi:hypothetical protein
LHEFNTEQNTCHYCKIFIFYILAHAELEDLLIHLLGFQLI